MTAQVPASSGRIEATFAFVDLAGFTALTEAQGDEDAADVATRFADIARLAFENPDLDEALVRAIYQHQALTTGRQPAKVYCTPRSTACVVPVAVGTWEQSPEQSTRNCTSL